MEGFQVSFDDNLAERGLRMAKAKRRYQVVFVLEQGANYFCRIRDLSLQGENKVRMYWSV